MKKIFVRVSSVMLVLALMGAMFSNASGSLSFSDVPSGYWGYDTIMNMTVRGLFKGMTEPVDGIGTFEPEKTMTRAEFMTVALRATFPAEAANISTNASPWWKDVYTLALEKGLLMPHELGNGALNQPMSREEMAMVMVRCVVVSGETFQNRIDTRQIADYASIGNYYKLYVLDCFSFGLIAGVDLQGTFAPAKTLTRAEAATVLCRLVDKSARVDVDYLDSNKGNTTSILKPNSGSDSKNDNTTDWEEDDDDIIIIPGGPTDSSRPSTPAKPSIPDIESPSSGVKDPMPWDDNNRKPDEYTYEEYEALTEEQQVAFQEWFGSGNGFDEWLNSVIGAEPELPWENGGKKPNRYTYAEFEALTEEQQVAFMEWFTGDGFDRWLSGEIAEDSDLPWEDGGKKPDEYTLEEFESLSEDEQIAFMDWFTGDGFDEWLMNAIG